jgi:hypothetical protein
LYFPKNDRIQVDIHILKVIITLHEPILYTLTQFYFYAIQPKIFHIDLDLRHIYKTNLYHTCELKFTTCSTSSSLMTVLWLIKKVKKMKKIDLSPLCVTLTLDTRSYLKTLSIRPTYIITRLWIKETGIGCSTCHPDSLVSRYIANTRHSRNKTIQFVDWFAICCPNFHSFIKWTSQNPANNKIAYLFITFVVLILSFKLSMK